jgi:vancomycin permeability regulator SanA
VIVIGLIIGLIPFAVVGVASLNRLPTIEEVEPHDVVIVYGAGLWGDGPSAYLAARLRVALELFEAGKVRVILVSGDYLWEGHNEPGAMKQWLIERGVPEAKIVQDFAGSDTYATCLRAKQIFGVESAILVSQSYHLPRAVATCRLIGLDAVGVGDSTVKDWGRLRWYIYVAREIPAIVKMAIDLLIQRQPIMGEPESGVTDALGS